MTTPAADPKPVQLSAPVDLDTIKDDLGIPAGDSTNDAWLQRRIDAIWSRFQIYTGRPLLLSSGWVDDWSRLVTNHPASTEPPLIRAWPSASVFLRVFPVQSLTRLVLNDQPVDVTRLVIEPASGKLVGLDDRPCDLRMTLLQGRALVEYAAGFETLPADLYDALLGTLAGQWAARQASASGVAPAGFMPTRINAVDVGEIELSMSPNAFVDATLKGVRTTDPLLGPYGMLLDPYVDWRSIIGGAYPSTSAAAEPSP